MCGIAGIFGQQGAAAWACEALFAQQHRGQDSCGLASVDGPSIFRYRGIGLVRDVITQSVLERLPGQGAIGHVRYPTQGRATIENAQPHLFSREGRPLFALASNGDITNLPDLRRELEARGCTFEGTNDGEVIAKAIGVWAFEDGKGLDGAIDQWMQRGMGAYSAVLLTPTHLYAFRDPHGLRPMSWGQHEGTIVVASETVAMDILRAEVSGHVEPGTVLRWGPGGFQQRVAFPSTSHHHCIFEHIYFARPDSLVFGEKVFEVRRAIGEALAEGDSVEGDVVVPIPDSANYIGLAYANARSLPIAFGLVRNHYVGRTFIAPEQRVRDETVRLKFNPLPGFFEGKRVFVVDDSIVRGTTIRKLVRMFRENGASQVHLRIGSPPIRHSCYYGIDTPEQRKLIASDRTPEQVAELLEADTLRYLSLEGLRSSVSRPDHYCYACFTGEYPAGCKRGTVEL
jgi:amidophosphoribosyltransferase